MQEINDIKTDDVCNIHDLILVLSKTVKKMNEVETQVKVNNVQDYDKNNKLKHIKKTKINNYKIVGRI